MVTYNYVATMEHFTTNRNKNRTQNTKEFNFCVGINFVQTWPILTGPVTYQYYAHSMFLTYSIINSYSHIYMGNINNF